jgi:hypothetical protein
VCRSKKIAMESMSPSEESGKLSSLIPPLRIEIERVIQDGEAGTIAKENLTSLLSGAVKLYRVVSEEAESSSESIPIIDASVSTTDAMVVACALLRAQHLNPFDLALWFSRTAQPPR